MTPWQVAATVVYFITVAGSVVFVVGRLKTPWRKYPEGKALLMQHVALVLLGGLVAAALIVGPDQWWYMPLYIVLLVAFGGAVWWLTYLQEKGRRLAAAPPAKSDAPEPPPVGRSQTPGPGSSPEGEQTPAAPL